MNKDDIIAAVLLFLFVGSLVFGIYAIITKVIIWVVQGVWGYDLSDAFWQVFVGILIIPLILKPNISINIKDKK